MTYAPPNSAEFHAIAHGQIPTRSIDIVLQDEISASSAHFIEELFQAANGLLDDVQYRVRVCTLSDLSSEGNMRRQRRSVVFLGDIHTRWKLDPKERARVNQTMRLTDRTAFVGGAVFLLYDLDRQDNLEVAIHPNFQPALQEFGLPATETDACTAVSGNVHSAISSFAAPQMFLNMIAEDCGAQASEAMSIYLGLQVGPAQPQSRIARMFERKTGGDDLIAKSVAVMLQNIESPLSIAELAAQLNISTRCLQRRYARYTEQTPLALYRALRVERAHQLLTLTNVPVRQIAVAAGFGTYQHLCRKMRETYGQSPDRIRRAAYSGGDLSAQAVN